MQLDAWWHIAWQWSCRHICIEHWPLHLWLVWNHSLIFCSYISSPLLLLHSHITLIGNQKSSCLALLQPDSDSGTFTWYVRHMHMHRRNIMSHNLVTKIKKMLTHSKIGAQIAFHWDMTSKMTICLSIPPLMEKLSLCLCRNPICIWWLAEEAICTGKSLRAQKTSLSA